VNKTV